VATKDRVTIELYVDDQGTVKIRDAKVATQELTQASTKGSADSAAGADAFASSLVKQIGIYALVIGAAYKFTDAVTSGFKAGIQVVDDYNVSVIGIAATLTDMAKADQGSMETVFHRNKAAAEDMYKAITLEAAKHFSSASEGMMVYNRLVQSGYAAQKSEVAALLLLTDKIKLATKGQNVEMQLNTEIIALMAGQARAQSMIAMELQSRLGAGWGDLVKKHREAGDLLTWITTLFPGLVTANKEIENTLNAQWATTKSLLDLLAIGGLSGAYDDIVGYVKDINKYLKDHGQELAGNIMTGWTAVKDVAGGVVLVVSEIVGWIKAGWGYLEGWRTSLSAIAKQRADLGVGMGLDVMGGLGEGEAGFTGPGSAFGAQEAVIAQIKRNNQALVDAANQYKKETYKTYLTDQGQTQTDKKKGGGKGGGGGGGRDTTDSLESLLMQLRQEEAKLTEGAFGGIDAWYTKITEKIKKLAMDDKQLKDGMQAASELKIAKEQKVADDLNKWHLGQMHRTTAAQMLEDKKKLDSVKGHAAEEAQVREVMAQHALERAAKLALAEDQQQKAAYDSLAQNSVLITDQVAWKEKSWELEKKITQAQLEQWFIGKDLTDVKKDEYRGLLALTNQAKEYNQARQKAVDLGTLEGWAIERAGEALKRSRSTIKDALTGTEKYFQDAFAQGIQGALSGSKKPWKEVGQTIVQSMILELNKKSFTKIWDEIAKKLAPPTKSTGAVGGGLTGGLTGGPAGAGDPAKELSTAAEGLQTASVGFNLNTAQFGLAAGGLLLSGIGIATNSQALVYAGAFLQMVGLTIQIIELLTATTTTTEFTGAAAALTFSAAALKFAADMLIMAAAASAVPFFHSGGMVAHEGLLVAHGGLNLDERLIKAQVGEGIIKRDTMAAYARRGISFDMLNSGRLPVAEAGAEGGGTVVHAPITFAPVYNYRPTQADMDRDAKMMVRAIKTHGGVGTRGQKFGSGRY
jgi:hypothetical protein